MFQVTEKIEVCCPCRVLSRFFVFLLFGLVVAGGAARAGEGCESNIKAFLQGYLERYDAPDTKYSYAFASLEVAKRDVVVYLSGNVWCGSGGCTTLILERNKSSYRVIQKLTLARLPILVLPTKTDGWHDLAMPVAGGGVVSEYFEILRFDGKKYRPVTPSVKSRIPPKGEPFPQEAVGSLLYR